MKNQFIFLLIVILFLTPFYFSQANGNLGEKLKGKILLQVESMGEAWYVNPGDNSRYFLGRPENAFSVMRNLGLGIKHEELSKYLDTKFPLKLSGKILLDVEENGEAYYIYPEDLKGYFLGRPQDAFGIMREKGLGISNNNLNKVKRAVDDVLAMIGITSEEFEKISGDELMSKLKAVSPLNQKEFLIHPMFSYTFKNLGNSIDEVLLVFAQTGVNKEYNTSSYSITPELFRVFSNEFKAKVMETMTFNEQVALIGILTDEEIDLFDDFVQDKLVDLNKIFEEIKNPTTSSNNCYCDSDIMNCSSFSSKSVAQDYFRCCMDLIGSDIHKLDGDNNGIACESY